MEINNRLVLACVKRCLKSILPLLAFFYKHKSPCVVGIIDGGICSQMRQYLLAKVFIDKGYEVEFDLSFYRTGFDMNGDQVRNFDLQKAFPQMRIRRCSLLKSFVYRHCYSYKGSFPVDDSDIWTKLKPPVILLGYYAEPAWLFNDLRLVFKMNPSVLDVNNHRIFNNIPENSVAVHVRRGDLSEVDTIGFYGSPASVEYFLDAIKYLWKRLCSPVFYFFSDGMDYVEKNIISNLPGNINYQMISNGSDKGYCDLFLISKCSHHITSKGSLGKYGACLNPNKGVVIISKDEKQLGPLRNFEKEIIRM